MFFTATRRRSAVCRLSEAKGKCAGVLFVGCGVVCGVLCVGGCCVCGAPVLSFRKRIAKRRGCCFMRRTEGGGAGVWCVRAAEGRVLCWGRGVLCCFFERKMFVASSSPSLKTGERGARRQIQIPSGRGGKGRAAIGRARATTPSRVLRREKGGAGKACALNKQMGCVCRQMKNCRGHKRNMRRWGAKRAITRAYARGRATVFRQRGGERGSKGRRRRTGGIWRIDSKGGGGQ